MSVWSRVRSAMKLRPSTVLRILGWMYLLRVPILTGFGLLVIYVLAFFTSARSHLGGAFDIESSGGIFWVSLIAISFASVVAVACRRVRCYGPVSSVRPMHLYFRGTQPS